MPLRILANENITTLIVAALRKQGNDVAWIAEDAAGVQDRDVIAAAVADHRVLLTFDRDFGELAFRRRLPTRSGVILLRLSGLLPDALAQRVAVAIASRDDWAGHFSVIEAGRVRMTPLPSRGIERA